MRLIAFLASSLLFSGVPGHGAAPSGTVQDPSPQEQAAKAATLDLLNRLIPAAEAELARDGADPIDVRALARRLGAPTAAFQWVRENIAFEPYEGVLRGAAGALAARAANSWDQALLLQELLAAMGQPSRIVQARLDDAQCNTLVDAFLRAEPRSQPEIDESQAFAEVARATGIAAAELRRAIGQQLEQASARTVGMQQLAAAHAAALLAALGDHRIDAAQMRKAAVDGVRRHAIVQLAAKRDGKLHFQDFDATPLGTADGASKARDATPVDDLPCHTCRLQLLYESAAGEVPILDVTTNLDRVLLAPMALQIAPASGLPPMPELAAMTPEQLTVAWQRVKLWQAKLRTGGIDRSSRVFDLDGGLHDVGGDGRIRAASDVGAAVARGFDAFGGGEEKAAKTTFKRLRIVVTMRTPDGQERVFPRQLLDADGRARGETPALRWDMLATGGPLSGDLVNHTDLVVQLRFLRFAASALTDDDAVRGAALDRVARSQPDAQPLILLRLQLVRQQQAALLATRNGVRPWYSSPQLLLLCTRSSPCPGDRGCASLGFDWMASDLRFLPVDAASAGAAFAAAVEQGALDSVLEAIALEQMLPTATVASAAHMLTRSLAAGRALDRLPVRDGRLALSVAGEGSWYEIDPAFGCTVGRLPGGSGGALVADMPQALVEYGEALSPTFWMLICVGVNEWGYGVGRRSWNGRIIGLAGCAAGGYFRLGGFVLKATGSKVAPFVFARIADLIGGFTTVGGFYGG
jgi:Transglutaminase-like superfamily